MSGCASSSHSSSLGSLAVMPLMLKVAIFMTGWVDADGFEAQYGLPAGQVRSGADHHAPWSGCSADVGHLRRDVAPTSALRFGCSATAPTACAGETACSGAARRSHRRLP